VPAVVMLAGVAGWLAEPTVRDAFRSVLDPMAPLSINPAGWLLGIAALRGAIHADSPRESDIATEAITYSFPILGVSLVVLLLSGHAYAGPALIGSAVCVVSGMLAIGYARRREFQSTGSVTTGAGVWQVISIGLVGAAAIAIPVALLVGAAAQDLLFGAARWIVDAGRAPVAWLAALAEWLITSITRLIPNGPVAHPPSPSPTSGFRPSSGNPQGSPGFWADWRGLLDVLVRLAIVGAAILLALLIRRLVRLRSVRLGGDAPTTAPEERRRDPFLSRFRPHVPMPSFRPRNPFRKRRPLTAAQAYVSLLDEMSDRGELARGPAETPRNHARRVADLGLEPAAMARLAADYQLSVYGRVTITDRETARAITRWQRIRAIVRRVPRDPGSGA
jgi:hypothetical protein